MTSLKGLLIALLLCAGTMAAAAQEHAAPQPPADQHAAPAAAQPAAQPPHGTTPEAATEHAEELAEDHAPGGGILETIAKLLNFAVLVAILVYFLRQPIAVYLVDRSQQIRHALVEAKATREQAATELARIEHRLGALPAELDALKLRGAEEVQAEQARIKAAAAAERERLLTQTRREIEQQYRLARRELVQETANQAAAIARARIEREITPADQARLIDRYLTQVRA